MFQSTVPKIPIYYNNNNCNIIAVISVGNCLVSLGGKGWGIDAWSVVRKVDGSSPADECGLSRALVLSLYFPYLFCPCISHTHRTNHLPPILPVPLISNNNDTHAPTAWCWELLFYIAFSGWLLISPLKCFWPVCWAVSGQASGLIRRMIYAVFHWLWELSRGLPL